MMHKTVIFLIMSCLIIGCQHSTHSNTGQAVEKINAHVIVSLNKTFINYQMEQVAVIKTLTFKFKDSIDKHLPIFFDKIFTGTTYTSEEKDIVNTKKAPSGVLAVPKFQRVTFYEDRTFGNELRVIISFTFTRKDNSKPLEIVVTGLADDMGESRHIYENDLSEKAFIDALKELQKQILKNRSFFEETTNN